LNISSVTADWFNLFDWETLLKNYSSNSYFGNAGFSNTNSSSYFSLSIKKKINQENYKKLWNLINTYKKWTSLSAFFKNCTFDGFYDLTIPSSNSTLTSVI
jgi:hypothetical protein